MNTEQWEKLLAAVEGGCPDHAVDPCNICDGDAGSVTVRETLHHGNTRDTRETTVPDLSPASVARVLARSLYAYDGMGAARVAAELTAIGKGDHGWSRFEVVPS